MKNFGILRWGTALLLFLIAAARACAGDTYWEPTINGTVFQGDVKRLIILVESEDRRFYTPNANYEYDIMLNQPGYSGLGCYGSARDYFIDNSGGKFRPEFIIAGPVCLSNPMGWYNGPVGNNGDLVVEACKLAKAMHPEIDFSELDYTGDGKVDNVYLFFAGPIADNTPWPHASGVGGGGLVIDGKLIDSYAISQEMATETIRGAYSTFVHEFGHTLGMPDDYSGRLGKFSIYCDGTFHDGVVPVNLNAGERMILGWLDYDVIDHDGEYTLEPLARNKALMLKTDNPDEYFLFSNRDNGSDITPWDSDFEFGGMLVWHIDRSQNRVTWTNDSGGTVTSTALGMWQGNQPNGSPDHPCHKLIDADGRNDPYASSYRGGMYFPGTHNITTLSSRTHEHFRSWDGLPLGVEIYDIRMEANRNITFKVRFEGNASVKVSVKSKDDQLQTNAYVSLTPVDIPGAEKLIGDTYLTGECYFSDVDPGLYRLVVDKAGYMVHYSTVEVFAGNNSFDILIQTPEENRYTELYWHDNGSGGLHAPQFDGKLKAVGWDATDLAPYVGRQLRQARIQTGGGPGENVGNLYVFIDDQVVYDRAIPDIVSNGVTTIDLSGENIVIPQGKSMKVGYKLTSAATWPYTADRSAQVPGKGGLESADDGRTWNDAGMGNNWMIWADLYAAGSSAVESIDFDEDVIRITVGQTLRVRANVYPVDVDNRTVIWESSDTSIATIDEEGNLKGVSAGIVTLMATSQSNPAISATCTVNVSFGSDQLTVVPYQRDTKIAWPGYNPDVTWTVKYRQTDATEYTTATAGTETSIYLRGLTPGTAYDGWVESSDSENTSPVEFAFVTNPLTSDFPVLDISRKTFALNDTLPLIALNIGTADHTVKWKIDGAETAGDEYTFGEAGRHEVRAEITYPDGSTDVLVKELEITK